jgi:hypothetical protein
MNGGRKKKYYIAGGVILVLVILRILLPYIVLRYANRSLAEMKGYYGHVNDIDLALLRGAYRLDEVYVNKLDTTGKQADFFKARTVDLSIEWNALFNGALVGEVKFFSPRLIFTKGKTGIGQVVKDTNDFHKMLDDFMPLRLNRFEMVRGEIHYTDKTVLPAVDIFLQDVHVLATNLENTRNKKEKLPSALKASAKACDGNITLNMKLDAQTNVPTFDMNMEIETANLVLMNDFFKAYGGFDVNKGSFGMYSEFSAAQNKFNGYVKPVVKDLDILRTEDLDNDFLQKFKEAVIGLRGNIPDNPSKKQVATRVPLEGNFRYPQTNINEAVWEILCNAFMEALVPAIDNEINIASPQITGKHSTE